ncbi:MAG: Rpn family recombination-promoting nuclease/putative transposase [Selenomonadaceae bacterium]|nr:Rpn family recombination-promoting nuclease/putative transposase [Selenomonadaceae bacterium]
MSEKPERLLSLYKAITNDQDAKVEDIKINSIHSIFTHSTYNDISFVVGNKHIVLVEHQSTINYNMPLRMLNYLSQLYLNQLPRKTLIYEKELITLPAPQFYVFYNGEEPFPNYSQLKLSDALQKDNSRLELIVDVYNINYEHNKELMHKCQELSHYSYLVHRIRHHKANGKSLDDAILIAIKDCIKHNIMLDYLLKHQSEVSEIMKLTWTRKGEIEYECEKAEARGMAIGETRGKALLTKVYSWLSDSNRDDDLKKSFVDIDLQNKLIDEYIKLHPTSPTTA